MRGDASGGMHQVYIAGSYAQREALCERAQQLMARGMMVTSNWLWWNPPDALVQDKDRLDATIWHLDFHGMLTAEIVMIDTTVESTKGGFHVELGMAISMLKPVIHIGPRPNAFYKFPTVTHYESWEECLSKYDEICKSMGDDFISKMHEQERGGPLPNRSDMPGLIIDLEKFLNQQRGDTNV